MVDAIFYGYLRLPGQELLCPGNICPGGAYISQVARFIFYPCLLFYQLLNKVKHLQELYRSVTTQINNLITF